MHAISIRVYIAKRPLVSALHLSSRCFSSYPHFSSSSRSLLVRIYSVAYPVEDEIELGLAAVK